jgi:hypothetical protein
MLRYHDEEVDGEEEVLDGARHTALHRDLQKKIRSISIFRNKDLLARDAAQYWPRGKKFRRGQASVSQSEKPKN